jgi:hypothetical protein
MSNTLKKDQIQKIAAQLGISIETVNRLRRLSMKLHRWHEAECNGDVETNEDTGEVIRYYSGVRGERVALGPTKDVGKTSVGRINDICGQTGLYCFIQSDPRGCALYVSLSPLTDSDYNRGIAIY